MSEFFLTLVNMSISASWIVLAVLLLRLVLKKAPKWISVLLWGIVALRLICPFTIESAMSLIPSAETISPQIMTEDIPVINSGIPIINETINPIIGESFTPAPGDSANPLQIWIPLLTTVWLVGVAIMLVYTAVSYFRVKRRIGTAIVHRDNIYQSERVVSPFVLGLIKPKIYLPFYMNEQDMTYVIAHENAHIRRKDHIWKPLGFLLLTLHWFNPLMWLGYILLCRDIELACDEKVIKTLDRDARADYSQALLSCSVNRRIIAACPLAFGEVGVKGRVKSVLNYKKPAFWLILIAIVACIAVAVCFLTNPPDKTDEPTPPSTVTPQGAYSEYDGVYITLDYIEMNEGHNIFHVSWHNDTDLPITYGNAYTIQYLHDDEWIDVRQSPETFTLIGYTLLPGQQATKTYSTENYSTALCGTYRLLVSFTVENNSVLNREFRTWILFQKENGSNYGLMYAKYPHFIGLDTSEGLTVYICQFAKNQYTCYLTSNAEETVNWTYLNKKGGITIGDMREILKYYNIPQEKIQIKAFQNPLSSYAYTIDEEYSRKLEEKFWQPIVEWAFAYSHDIDNLDIDGDGKEEVCGMLYGTSDKQPYSLVIYAQDLGAEKPKYHTTFYPRSCYSFRFEIGEDGVVRVRGFNHDVSTDTHLYDISIEDGEIVLTENGNRLT